MQPSVPLPLETLRRQHRALWPCTAAHSPSSHSQWLFIPSSSWKGGRLGALQAGNVNIKLRFLCSCCHVGGEEPFWGYFGACLRAWEAIKFLKGDFAVVDVLLLTWSLQFGSLSLGGAALDQIFPLVQVEIKMNSEFCSCTVSCFSWQPGQSLPPHFSCPGRKTWIPSLVNLSRDPTLPFPRCSQHSPSPGL